MGGGGRLCAAQTQSSLSPSPRLSGNSSLAPGQPLPRPAPPLRSVWNRILPPHLRPATASYRSCRVEPRVSHFHVLLVEWGKGAECAGVQSGAPPGESLPGPSRRAWVSSVADSTCSLDSLSSAEQSSSGEGPPSTMVKLGCSFSGKPGKDPGEQDGVTMDSVPLISPLDVSQLQPPFPDQVVIKTQTEYQLSSLDQPKKFPDLEAQKLACSHPEEGRRLPTARMIAFAMALLGCVLIMYKAIWYDQFTCPDGFLLRHKICTPLTLEMYYTEMDPERHRSILAAIGAYPLSRKHGTDTPSAGRPRRPPQRALRRPPSPPGSPRRRERRRWPRRRDGFRVRSPAAPVTGPARRLPSSVVVLPLPGP
ncbi:hypothetical protein MC885_014598 [Smutsia gigantea]|nr:hypothetical protein MC885_014598 [Smutsia gigantea]